MWNVYVLVSLVSAKFYVGMTQNVERRLAEHNSGKSKFTSGHVPWKLIYKELVGNVNEARAREKYLKSAAGKRFIQRKTDAGSQKRGFVGN